MAGNEINWAHKIDQSDENITRSTGENFAIEFLEKNRLSLPADRFHILVSQTIEILKKREVQEKDIQRECAILLNKLKEEGPKKERNFSDKAGAVISDLRASTDVFTSNITSKMFASDTINSTDKIQVFRNGKNDTVSIGDFEKELSEKNIVDINSMGFSSYIIYVNDKKLLSKSQLEKAFGRGNEAHGKEKLLDLALIWGIEESDARAKNATQAQTILAKENPAALASMRKILAEGLREFLFGKKYEETKKAFKNRFPTTFDEKEFDTLARGGIIELSTLISYFKKVSGGKIRNIGDLNAVLTAHANDLKTEQKRTEIQSKLISVSDTKNIVTLFEEGKISIINIPEKLRNIALKNLSTEERASLIQVLSSEVKKGTPVQKELIERIVKKLELMNRKVQIQVQEKAVRTTKNAITLYNEGNGTKKNIDDFIKNEEWIPKKERKKTTEGFVQNEGKKENITKNKEESSDTNTEASVPRGWRGYQSLEIDGPAKEIKLSKEANAPSIRIAKIAENRYKVQIEGQEKITLLGDEVRGYIQTYRLLQNTGLSSMMRVSYDKLSKIIASCSHDGNKIDVADDFGKKERMCFLKTMAKVLGIQEVTSSNNLSTIQERFNTGLMRTNNVDTPEKGFERMAQEQGFMTKDGSPRIIGDKLLEKILQNHHSS